MMNNSANQSQNSQSNEEIHTSRMTTSSNGLSHGQQMTFAYQNPQYKQQWRQQDQVMNQKAISPSSDLNQRFKAQKEQQHQHWPQLGDYPWQQQQQEPQHFSQTLDLNNQFSQFPSSETVKMSQTLPKPVLQSHLQSNLAYHQHQPQPYQNIIINKMLENSYIPSGNGKDVRRAPNNFEEPTENLHAHFYQHHQKDLQNSCKDQSRLLNPVNPNNQAQIEETEMYNTGNSDTNIIKNLSQALDQSDAPKLRHNKNPPHATNQGSQKHLAFQDRNNQWLQQKQQNIEKAKEILDLKEGRQCPFKPQTQIYSQNLVRGTTRSRSSKNKERLFSPKLPNSKVLKEEGVQVNVGLEPFQHSMINSNSTSSQLRKFDEANQTNSAHTTNKLNEAIDLMCLYDSSGQGNKDYRMLDLSKECDATCLTPGAKPNPNDSNIESASFLSLGGNERDIYDHQAIPVPVQTMKIKQLNF